MESTMSVEVAMGKLQKLPLVETENVCRYWRPQPLRSLENWAQKREQEWRRPRGSQIRSQRDNTEWVPCARGLWADDRLLALLTLPTQKTSCFCFCSISQNALPLVWRLTELRVIESNRLRVDPCKLRGKLQDQGTSKITKQFQNYGLTKTEGRCRGREGSRGTGIKKICA